MRELVIVIQDLYLPASAAAPAALAHAPVGLPGLDLVARFGARQLLRQGWRAWLTAWAGRADLAGTAPARIAAAAHPHLAHSQDTLWIAVPVHLSAGLSRVHLAQGGLLYLSDAELAQLAQDFTRAFAGSGFSLTPASPRELLLLTPGVDAVATQEPARFAGHEVNEALPRGPAAAGLRRTWAEAEMWLHVHPVNLGRRVPVTALWPWGAQGARAVTAAPAASTGAAAAFAADAYVRGLWRVCGLDVGAVPEDLELVCDSASERAVLVLEAGVWLQDSAEGLGAALAQLDARYLAPAVQMLRAGALGTLRLLANDHLLTLTSRSHLKFWRPVRRGLGALA